MPSLHTLLFPLLLGALLGVASAQDINLQPKYGLLPKTEAQKAADAQFLATVDGHYKGDRKKAAEDVAHRGWQFLRQGSMADAMRRFNQAWLLDASNGTALWGMAAVQASVGKTVESLKLFAEAEAIVGQDIDFAVDHARTIGMAGARDRNDALLSDAFARFAQLHRKAPQHTLNLQNWAITLFHIGNYAEAWNKVMLAEATPRRAELDPAFVSALQGKMPRP